MTRFYITMTWHNWPDGGYWGETITAIDQNEAITAAKEKMAESLVNERGCDEGEDHDTAVAEALSNYADEWMVVDCFDLDIFLVTELREAPASTRQLAILALRKAPEIDAPGLG